MEIRRNSFQSLARKQYHLQRFAESLQSARRSAELTRTLEGKTAPALAEDLGFVVQVLMDLGRFAEATDIMRQVRSIREAHGNSGPGLVVEADVQLRYLDRLRQLSPADLDALQQARTKVAQEAQRAELAGHLEEAIRLADGGLSQRYQVLGYADRVYLEDLGVQSLRLLSAGHGDRAAACAEQAEHGYRGLYGARHRWRASALNLAALIQERAGEAGKALVLRQQATEIYLTALGPEHSVARQSVEMLAASYRSRGRDLQTRGELTQAAETYQRESQLWRRVLGPDDWHAREADVMRRYLLRADALTPSRREAFRAAGDRCEQARTELRAGHFDQALRLARQAQATSEEIFGDDCPTTPICLALVAEAEEKQGDFAAAQADWRRLWSLQSKCFGSSHPQSHQALRSLLDLWEQRIATQRNAGDLAGAELSCVPALQLSVEGYGRSDWRTMDYRVTLNDLHRLVGLNADLRRRLDEAQTRYDESGRFRQAGHAAQAIAAMREALKIRREILGDSDRVANCLHALGNLYREAGDLPAAQTHTQQALEIRARLLGKSHPKYADTLANWAVLLGDLDDYPRAIDAFQQARATYRDTRGTSSADYVRTLDGLAMAYTMGMHNLAEAEPLLEESLNACRQPDFADRTLYANVMHNLAGVYANLGREADATALYQQAATLWTKQGDWAAAAKSMDQQAILRLAAGAADEAVRLHGEALQVFREWLGPQHPDTLICMANLAAAQIAAGHLPEALAVEREALQAAEHNLELATALASEEQELRITTGLRRHLDGILDLTARDRHLDQETYDAVLRWKGRMLLRQRWQRLDRAGGEIQRQVDQLRELTAQVAGLTFHPPSPDDRPQWQRQLAEAGARRRDAQSQLRSVLWERGKGNLISAAAWPHICSVLDGRTARSI